MPPLAAREQGIKLGQPLFHDACIGAGRHMIVQGDAGRSRRKEDGNAARHRLRHIAEEGRTQGRFFAGQYHHVHAIGRVLPCGGYFRRRTAHRKDATQVGSPAIVHVLEQSPATEKFAAHARTGFIDAATFAAQMLTRHARLLLQPQRHDLEIDATGGAGTASAFCQRGHGSNRVVAVSIRSSSWRMNSTRFRPGGMGGRNSSMMVPAFFWKPVQ